MFENEKVAARLRLSGAGGVGPESARAILRSAQAGDLHRLRRGVYTATAQEDPPGLTGEQRARSRRDRYIERAWAVGATRKTPIVYALHAAAAILGLPVWGRWPEHVDVLVDPSSRCRSKNGVHVHRDRFDSADLVEVDGAFVTSPARTVLDLARSGAIDDAVVALDYLLNPTRAGVAQRVQKDDIRALIAAAASPRGLAMAEAVVEFADGASGSVGETGSRIQMFRAGIARPELQVRHPSKRRSYYETDFEWPTLHKIGEFDGRGKYLKENLPPGMSPGDAVHEEKLREDELRREGNGMVRWGWTEVSRPSLLIAALTDAGVPLVRPPRLGLGPW